MSELLRSLNCRFLLPSGGGRMLGFKGELRASSILLGLLSGIIFLADVNCYTFFSSLKNILLLKERCLKGDTLL
jgi:hypothetical protein